MQVGVYIQEQIQCTIAGRRRLYAKQHAGNIKSSQTMRTKRGLSVECMTSIIEANGKPEFRHQPVSFTTLLKNDDNVRINEDYFTQDVRISSINFTIKTLSHSQILLQSKPCRSYDNLLRILLYRPKVGGDVNNFNKAYSSVYAHIEKHSGKVTDFRWPCQWIFKLITFLIVSYRKSDIALMLRNSMIRSKPTKKRAWHCPTGLNKFILMHYEKSKNSHFCFRLYYHTWNGLKVAN